VPLTGLFPWITQGGGVPALQMVLGTAVQFKVSGEVGNVTVVVKVPVVENVTRQLTQGVLPERFEWVFAAWVPSSPVKGKVNEQSGLFCAASGRHVRAAQRIRRVKGMALRSVVMPHILRQFRLRWKGSRQLPGGWPTGKGGRKPNRDYAGSVGFWRAARNQNTQRRRPRKGENCLPRNQ